MKLNKRIIFLSLFIFLSLSNIFSLNADELVRKFIAGNLSDKVSVLKQVPGSGAETFLTESSFAFVSNYYTLLENDADFKNLVLETIKNAGPKTSEKNIYTIQRIYTYFDDENIKVAVINKIPELTGDLSELIQLVNEYVKKTLKDDPDYQNSIMFSNAVHTLALCSDSSSFDVLFACLSKGLPLVLKSEVETALGNMASENRSHIIAILAGNPPEEKLLAFRISQKKQQNSDFFCEEIAENALAITINSSEESQNIPDEINRLQLEAMKKISESSWTRASSLAIRYFELAKKQFAQEKISSSDFVEIINCLASLGTQEAGKALSSYLAALNMETEQTGKYDKDVVLAVIKSLGIIGEKSSFDYLLYVISFSTYSEEIINASRDSLARIKW